MKKLLAVGALAAGLSFLPQTASATNVGGVEFDSGPIFVFAGSIFETQPLAPGQTLSGYGSVSNIDGNNFFCGGCELTFTFDNYNLDAVGDLDGQGDGADFQFSGGTVTFYVDNTPDFNANTGVSTANDGNVWLTLAGDEYTNINGITGTLIAEDVDFSTGINFGLGFFDVTGGAAAGNLDTNLAPAGANVITDGDSDFVFTSSFQQAANPADPANPVQGTGELQGNAIPEPGTLALLGLGLLGLGATRRRKA